MAKKKEKEKEELKALYLKVESLNDLARSAISERQTRIMAIKSGKSYGLMSEGEKLDGVRTIHCFDVEKIARYVVYTADEEKGERSEITNDVASRQDHYKAVKLPIVELSSYPYVECKREDLKQISKVEAKDYSSIIRSLINSATNEDAPTPKIYAFFNGSSHLVGSFEVFWEHGKVLTYAKVDSKASFASISYDYNSDKVEPTNSIAEPSKILIKVINLSEPFMFFKSQKS